MKLVRLWFVKENKAVYASHLDLNRCMLRAVRRARLPIWYTEGFNPHPFLTFALPLSLGFTGLRETMDLKLLEDMPLEQVKHSLNAVLPEGIRVTDVREAVMKPGDIAFARYNIRLRAENASPETLLQSTTETLSRAELVVPRKTKSGVKDIDLAGCIPQYEAAADGNTVRLDILLPAGSAQNINPTVVIDALTKYTGFTLCAQVQRTDIYNKEMASFC